MDTTVMNAVPAEVEPVDHAAILKWLGEVRSVMQTESCAELFVFDGVDAFDVLLSPLFLSVLQALRGSHAPQPLTRQIVTGARLRAFQVKVALRQRLAAWRSAAVHPADVLLWTREITHTAVLQPVAAALRARDVSCGLLTCQAKTFNQLRGQGIESVYALGAWPDVVRNARREGRRRAKLLAAFGPWRLPLFEHSAASGLEPVVRRTAVRMLPFVSEALANARAALHNFHCRLLVVGNDLTIEGRAGCRVARARGIPTAVFMHGSITGDERQMLHCADRVLVFGESHRRLLMKHDISGERIVVSGSPGLDHRPQQTGRIHPALVARLGLEQDKPWILVATSGPGHRISQRHHETVIANLTRLSGAIPNVNIVVKLHRKDRLEHYRQAMKQCAGRKLHVVPHNAEGFPRDILDWLQGCSLVLTGASTVAVEAMLMDVPVITMDYSGEIDQTDFIQAGATLHVRTGDALQEAVRTILAAGGVPSEVQSCVRAYLEDSFLALDGGSAQRGADALCGLAGIGAPQ